MTKHYCHKCTLELGIITPSIPVSLSGSSYQLNKFMKHTAPKNSYPLNGIFNDPSYERYANYVVTTLASGSSCILDDGRINMYWVAGSTIGAQIEGNKPVVDADTITVVFADDVYRIHAFPTVSSNMGITNCENCGVPIISGSY